MLATGHRPEILPTARHPGRLPLNLVRVWDEKNGGAFGTAEV